MDVYLTSPIAHPNGDPDKLLQSMTGTLGVLKCPQVNVLSSLSEEIRTYISVSFAVMLS